MYPHREDSIGHSPVPQSTPERRKFFEELLYVQLDKPSRPTKVERYNTMLGDMEHLDSTGRTLTEQEYKHRATLMKILEEELGIDPGFL